MKNGCRVRYQYPRFEFSNTQHTTDRKPWVVLASGLLGLLAAAGIAAAQGPLPDSEYSATGMVDALNGVFGKQTTGRAIHAKGIVTEGTFTPASAAADLSRARHLKGGTTPVTVRFSDFAGIPTIPDVDGLATPRGIAVKFSLPGGDETDLVAHSFNGFPSPTAQEFRHLMIAVGTSGPGNPAPTPFDRYLDGHPIAKAFFQNQPPPPVSFVTLPYYGVNSFQFTNAKGERRFGRYQIIPSAGSQWLSKEAIAAAGNSYLQDELRHRLEREPAEFTIQVQLSAPGDAIDNPSIAWPESRPVVKLGVLRIEKVRADSDSAQQALLFTPTAVTDGIAPADPMIDARNAAYGVSYGRRHGGS